MLLLALAAAIFHQFASIAVRQFDVVDSFDTTRGTYVVHFYLYISVGAHHRAVLGYGAGKELGRIMP